MSKTNHSQSRSTETLASAATAAVPELQAIEDRLPFSEALTLDERKHLRHVAEANHEDVITRLIALATRHDGSIAGVPFDPVAAKESLADAKAARALANVARTLFRRLDDEAIRREAAVSEQSTAVLIALRGLVRTPQGKALGQEFADIMQVKRTERRKRRPKGETASPPAAVSPTQPTAQGGARSAPAVM